MGGFDGPALFSEDLFRSAPFDPTVSISGFSPGAAAVPAGSETPEAQGRAARVRELLSPRTLELARSYRDRAAGVPLHPLGGPFSVPPAGGFADLAPDLPGITRSGGFGAVNASSHGARADGVHEFTFGSGPARRFVGEMTPSEPDPFKVIPGGQSGVLGHPFFASQLPLWLTNRYHPFPFRPNDVVRDTVLFEVFLPED